MPTQLGTGAEVSGGTPNRFIAAIMIEGKTAAENFCAWQISAKQRLINSLLCAPDFASLRLRWAKFWQRWPFFHKLSNLPGRMNAKVMFSKLALFYGVQAFSTPWSTTSAEWNGSWYLKRSVSHSLWGIPSECDLCAGRSPSGEIRRFSTLGPSTRSDD